MSGEAVVSGIEENGSGKIGTDYPLFSSSDDEAVGLRLGVQRGPHQPLGHGVELKAAVEAPGEAGEVALGVLGADVVVGASERRLDVAERGVDPVERRPLRRLLSAASGHRKVVAARLGDRLPAGQAIADDVGAGGEARLGQLGDLGLAEPLDDLQLQTSRLAIEARLDGCHERRLAGGATATLAARANPPRQASSTSTRPEIFGLPASRSAIADISLCFIGQAVGWRTSSLRANSIELIPPLACVNS